MNDEKKFTLYWRDGKREVVEGKDIAYAVNRRGYSRGALAVLDFYMNGDNNDYEYNKATREWDKK